jgi:hypothetical protein
MEITPKLKPPYRYYRILEPKTGIILLVGTFCQLVPSHILPPVKAQTAVTDINQFCYRGSKQNVKKFLFW